MQGDPRVDDLMRLVGAAIKRHVKDHDAVVLLAYLADQPKTKGGEK